jgi:hypothetical protein
MNFQSLGTIPLPSETIEHDFTMLERYQEFSAELLRVSLIAISAIGYAFSKVLFSDTSEKTATLNYGTKCLVILALAFLCFSSGTALLHRYAAVDSMSWHLQALRRSIRNQGEDSVCTGKEFHRRLVRFHISRWAIALSALSLAIGVILVVLAIVNSLH